MSRRRDMRAGLVVVLVILAGLIWGRRTAAEAPAGHPVIEAPPTAATAACAPPAPK